MGGGPSFNPFANRAVMRYLNRKAEAARESLTRSGERARLDEEELHALERKLHYAGRPDPRRSASPSRRPSWRSLLVIAVGLLLAVLALSFLLSGLG
jgi:hypothetical protein